MVEDENNNKFGCYSNGEITKKNVRTKDYELFLFSIRSNGRYSGMTKIEPIDNPFGFGLFEKNREELVQIGFGPAISILKKSCKNNSKCVQNDEAFDYHRIERALCGVEPNYKGEMIFKPKKIIVIQMK